MFSLFRVNPKSGVWRLWLISNNFNHMRQEFTQMSLITPNKFKSIYPFLCRKTAYLVLLSFLTHLSAAHFLKSCLSLVVIKLSLPIPGVHWWKISYEDLSEPFGFYILWSPVLALQKLLHGFPSGLFPDSLSRFLLFHIVEYPLFFCHIIETSSFRALE